MVATSPFSAAIRMAKVPQIDRAKASATTTVKVSAETKEAIEVIAKATGASQTEVIEHLLAASLPAAYEQANGVLAKSKAERDRLSKSQEEAKKRILGK